MLPLPAGGHRATLRVPAGHLDRLSVLHRSRGAAIALGLLPILVAGAAPAAESAEPGIVQVIAPMAAPSPVRSVHWTLREPITVAQRIDDENAVPTPYGQAHAEVAVFSWREILFYAMGVVAVVAGLLALAGNHQRPSRHF